MKQRTHQQGSAPVIIIIVVIVLVVLGALASIFWQNFTKQMGDAAVESEKKTAQQTESSSKADALKPENITLNSITSAVGGGYSMTLKFPSTWKEETADDKHTITSADGSVTLNFGIITPATSDGTCGEDATVKSVEWSKLAGFSKGMFSSIIWQSAGSGYEYQFGMVSASSGVDELKAGGTICQAGPARIVELSKSPLTYAYIIGDFAAIPPTKAPTYETIRAALQSDNGIIAERIVESAVIKD